MQIKKFCHFMLRVLCLDIFYFLAKKNSFLRETGWYGSFKTKQSINDKGEPIPWMTYPFLKFIKCRLTESMKVFEYGAGNSTLWWAKHVSQVISCEHDLAWFQKIRAAMPKNAELHHCEISDENEYSQFIHNYKSIFDIIVIDGRQRVLCIKNSLPALTKNGIVVWDNSDRSIYNEGYEFLKNHGFKQIDFWGMGPINSYSWCTSIFYRENNVLGI